MHPFRGRIKRNDSAHVQGFGLTVFPIQNLDIRMMDFQAATPPGVRPNHAAEHDGPAHRVSLLHVRLTENEPNRRDHRRRIRNRDLEPPPSPSAIRDSAPQDGAGKGLLKSGLERGDRLEAGSIHVLSRQKEERIADRANAESTEDLGPLCSNPMDRLHAIGERGFFRPPFTAAEGSGSVQFFFPGRLGAGFIGMDLGIRNIRAPDQTLDALQKLQRLGQPNALFLRTRGVESGEVPSQGFENGQDGFLRMLGFQLIEPGFDGPLESRDGINLCKIVAGDELQGSSELIEGREPVHRGRDTSKERRADRILMARSGFVRISARPRPDQKDLREPERGDNLRNSRISKGFRRAPPTGSGED